MIINLSILEMLPGSMIDGSSQSPQEFTAVLRSPHHLPRSIWGPKQCLLGCGIHRACQRPASGRLAKTPPLHCWDDCSCKHDFVQTPFNVHVVDVHQFSSYSPFVFIRSMKNQPPRLRTYRILLGQIPQRGLLPMPGSVLREIGALGDEPQKLLRCSRVAWDPTCDQQTSTAWMREWRRFESSWISSVSQISDMWHQLLLG